MSGGRGGSERPAFDAARGRDVDCDARDVRDPPKPPRACLAAKHRPAAGRGARSARRWSPPRQRPKLRGGGTARQPPRARSSHRDRVRRPTIRTSPSSSSRRRSRATPARSRERAPRPGYPSTSSAPNSALTSPTPSSSARSTTTREQRLRQRRTTTGTRFARTGATSSAQRRAVAFSKFGAEAARGGGRVQRAATGSCSAPRRRGCRCVYFVNPHLRINFRMGDWLLTSCFVYLQGAAHGSSS